MLSSFAVPATFPRATRRIPPYMLDTPSAPPVRPTIDDAPFAKGDWVVSTNPAKATEGQIVAISRKGAVKVRIHSDRAIWLSPSQAKARLRVVPIDSRELECHKCVDGSGLFYKGGAVVNGVYTGEIGPCYGCQGHGLCTPHDRYRNRSYWNKYATIHFG